MSDNQKSESDRLDTALSWIEDAVGEVDHHVEDPWRGSILDQLKHAVGILRKLPTSNTQEPEGLSYEAKLLRNAHVELTWRERLALAEWIDVQLKVIVQQCQEIGRLESGLTKCQEGNRKLNKAADRLNTHLSREADGLRVQIESLKRERNEYKQERAARLEALEAREVSSETETRLGFKIGQVSREAIKRLRQIGYTEHVRFAIGHILDLEWQRDRDRTNNAALLEQVETYKEAAERYNAALGGAHKDNAALREQVEALDCESDREAVVLRGQVENLERDLQRVVTDRDKLKHRNETAEKDISVLLKRVVHLEHANRTRKDYDLYCQQCGKAHIIDTSLPSEVWNKIAEPNEVLCTLCIDERLAAKGLPCEAEFYFVGDALHSKLYGDANQ